MIDLTLDNQADGSGGNCEVSASWSSIRPIFDRVSKRSVAAADPMVEQLIATRMRARWSTSAAGSP